MTRNIYYRYIPQILFLFNFIRLNSTVSVIPPYRTASKSRFIWNTTYILVVYHIGGWIWVNRGGRHGSYGSGAPEFRSFVTAIGTLRDAVTSVVYRDTVARRTAFELISMTFSPWKKMNKFNFMADISNIVVNCGFTYRYDRLWKVILTIYKRLQQLPISFNCIFQIC